MKLLSTILPKPIDKEAKKSLPEYAFMFFFRVRKYSNATKKNIKGATIQMIVVKSYCWISSKRHSSFII